MSVKEKRATKKEQEDMCKAMCKIINKSMKTLKELGQAFRRLARIK